MNPEKNHQKEVVEALPSFDRIDKVLGWILLCIFILFIVFWVASLTRSNKEVNTAPIEAPMEHDPTQIEMNGWREPSAFDVIIHSDSGLQEPDT